MQYLVYPTKKMNITQNYNGTYSHYDESHGVPCSFPIDENCGDKGRSYFYAPCDLIVKQIKGIKNATVNTIWLESLEKVKLANGKESYVTISVTHPNDDTLVNFKPGQIYKQYDKMFLEGNDGKATGYHFHIEVSTCLFKQLEHGGWVKNDKGIYVMAPKAIKPEEAFFIDKKFTTVVSSNSLKFKYLSTEEISYYKKCQDGCKSLVDGLKSINVDSSFNNRRKIANKNGILLYIGSSSQNTKLLNLLITGKLKK